MEGKVIPFTGKSSIFNGAQREGISRRLSAYTEKPQEATAAVEDELCRQVVIAAREVATAIGQRIGAWIANKAFKTQA